MRLKLLSESDASQLKFEPSALAAIATGISCDSISSSILQPAFLAAVTSGASDADVNSALAREAAAKYSARCSFPNLLSNSVRMAFISKSFNSGRFNGDS